MTPSPWIPLRVSVVIPCFNGGSYLREAIDSVLAQNYPDIEIIVVDDGSTDNSAEIARSFSDQVRYFSNPHQGLPATLNAGLKQATGEFIAFIDADDVWPAGRLLVQIDIMKQDPSATAALGTLQRFFAKSKDGAIVREFVDESMPALSLGASLFRRTVFDVIGNFDTALLHGNDIDWFMRAKESGQKIVHYNQISLFYRRHDKNLTNDQASGTKFLLNIAKQAIDRRRRKQQAAQADYQVSAIIPTYDRINMVGRAIESAMNQSVSPFEIIVVDDGSTDGTQEMIASRFPNVRYFYQQNGGPSVARNKGVSESKGNVIAFLDSDDLWPKDKLEIQLGVLKADASLDIATGRMQPVHLKNNDLNAGFDNVSEPIHSFPSLNGSVIKKSCFDRVGLFDTRLRFAEDMDWALRANEVGLKRLFHEGLVSINISHDASMTTDERKTEQGTLLAIRYSLARRRQDKNRHITPFDLHPKP